MRIAAMTWKRRTFAGLVSLLLCTLVTNAYADEAPREPVAAEGERSAVELVRDDAHRPATGDDGLPMRADLLVSPDLAHAHGQRLRDRGDRMRAGGWSALAVGGASLATAGVFTAIVLDAEGTYPTPDKPIYRLEYGGRRALPASMAGVGLLLSTAVAIPLLVVGQRYRRAGDALLRDDKAGAYSLYPNLMEEDVWNHRLVVAAQKRRTARALNYSALVVTGVAAVLIVTSVLMVPKSKTDQTGMPLDQGSNGFEVLMGAGAALTVFVALPLLISGLSLSKRAQNITRRERANLAQVQLSPIMVRGGGGGSLVVNW